MEISQEDETVHRPERSVSPTRILAPDVARGMALLGIALANIATAWLAIDSSTMASSLGGVINDSIPEKIAVVLSAMFVHVRGLPMFSTLLGYGVGMIVQSLWRRGYPVGKTRALLVRRYGFLAIFGVVHMVFLFWGDIMFFYGVAGMLFALLITLKDKTLWWFVGVMAAVTALGTIIFTVLFAGVEETGAFSASSLQSESYGEYLLVGILFLVSQLFALPIEILMLMPLMIVGFLAARHQVLFRVDEFRRVLWIAVWVAVAVIVFVGIPWGLAEISVLPSSWAPVFSGLNQAFGVFTGPGIVAAIALLVQPLQRTLNTSAETGESPKVPLVLRMIAALGARSMSGYVGQSILLLLLTQPFTLGLGIGKGILSGMLIALLVWVVTLLGAYILELGGRRGPFETAHRYFSYGKTGLQTRYSEQVLLATPSDKPLPEREH